MKITHGGIESETANGLFGRTMDGQRMFRAAFWTALAFTLFFSLYPHDAVQETFSEEVQAFDWLFHALCYAALSATWLLGRAKRPHGLLPRLDAALAFASLGFALELAQALIPFVARTCMLSDAAANTIGAFLGALSAPLPDDAPAPAS